MPPTLRQFLIALSAPWAISTAGVVAVIYACRAGAEGNLESSALGIFIGGLIVIALITPALIAAQATSLNQVAALIGALSPWGVCWAWVAIHTQTLAAEWRGASLILVAFAAAMAGLCAMLIALRLSRALAVGMVTLLGVLWITWPIWSTIGITKTGQASQIESLWRHHGGTAAVVIIAMFAVVAIALRYRPRPTIGALVLLFAGVWLIWPLLTISTQGLESGVAAYESHLGLNVGLAINGQVYRQFGSWSEQSVAYHLTELNQSVAYAFPGTMWPTVGWHLGVGVFGFLMARVAGRGDREAEHRARAAEPVG